MKCDRAWFESTFGPERSAACPCPQWQEHELRLKAVDLLTRVVDLVSVHLETEHEELYREVDELLREAQS